MIVLYNELLKLWALVAIFSFTLVLFRKSFDGCLFFLPTFRGHNLKNLSDLIQIMKLQWRSQNWNFNVPDSYSCACLVRLKAFKIMGHYLWGPYNKNVYFYQLDFHQSLNLKVFFHGHSSSLSWCNH